jgi:hypothetical protein
MSPGEIMVGAGLSGQVAVRPNAAPSQDQAVLQNLTVGPGIAPWAAGRAGLPYSNEAGLTYSGRALRLDARHAFSLGKSGAISLGLGATALMAHRPGVDRESAVLGGGADVPLLIGWRSTGGLYAFWFGPRGGFEIVSGGIVVPNDLELPLYGVQGKHFFGGLTLGARIGFRHVHLALEVNAAYHHADGTFSQVCLVSSLGDCTPSVPLPAPVPASIQQISVTPAGALEVTF